MAESPVQDAGSFSDRRYYRERRARLEAEAIAEQGLRDLFQRQQEIQLLSDIAEAANSARSVTDAMKAALDAICSYTHWPIGHYCSVVSDPLEGSSHVVSTDTWHLNAQDPDQSLTHSEAALLAGQLGLADRVLASGTPIWIGDVGKDVIDSAGSRSQRPSPARPRAAFGLPVLAGTDVAAVLEFYGPESAGPDRGRLDLLLHVGVQLGRVIERERARARTVDAFHDSLTRLPNRSLFLRFVERALKRRARDSRLAFAVLFIDLDGFKTVNDSLGHRAGDALLLQFGLRLAQTIRSTDMVGRLTNLQDSGLDVEHAVARLGGDEFTVLLEDVGEVKHALQVADRIHAALAAPFALDDGVEVYAPASIGIAWGRDGQKTAEDVLQDADMAMYRAKAGGKNRTEIFDEDMHQQAVGRLQLETDLRRAVPRNELSLVYQPIVRLDTSEIVGVEALVRWRHPALGVVFPSAFISIAEDRGIILEIGGWVLREACRQLRHWQRVCHRPTLAVAVNLSARQFAQVDLVAQVEDVIRESGIDATCLSLELTESIAMGSPKESRQQLAALRRLGIDLAIDDFGTGHSSLSYLGQFRVSSLKVDRSFIQQLDEDYGETLVRAVLSLGTNLGLRVIAEGVETAREHAHLRRLGCSYAQGFHFSSPLEAEAVESLLARSN